MIKIRHARHADLDAVCRVETDGDATWSQTAFSAELAGNPWFLVAERENQLVGFALGRFDGVDAELLKIAVAPQYRKQGVARALLDELLRLFKQNGAVVCHLEVNVFNTAAIGLYRQFGFAITGRRAGYYKTANGREDALLMTGEINEESDAGY